MNGPAIPAFLLKPSGDADPALPAHARIGVFEIRRVLDRGTATTVYLATDHALAMPVAIQEFLPTRLVHRSADGRLHSADPHHAEALERGLQAFIAEARMLARCDHPALVRVLQLFEANGTAYRVMPHYTGQRLLDLRRLMSGAPDEASLRALLEALLGALEVIHRSGQSHGGVSAANILLLSDDRPLLLGPGAAAAATGSDLVDTLMASVTTAHDVAPDDAATTPSGTAADLYALADVMRYCISGELVPPGGMGQTPEPLATTIQRRFEPLDRPHYSAMLLDALDAAASPLASERPISALQFRSWIDGTAPLGRRIRVAPAAVEAPAAPVAGEPAKAAPVAAGGPQVEDRWDAADAFAQAHASRTGAQLPHPATPPAPAALRSGRGVPRPSWQQWLFGGGLAVLAAGLIAFATGAWDLMPTMPMERPTAEVRNPFVPLAPPASARDATPDAGAASAALGNSAEVRREPVAADTAPRGADTTSAATAPPEATAAAPGRTTETSLPTAAAPAVTAVPAAPAGPPVALTNSTAPPKAAGATAPATPSRAYPAATKPARGGAVASSAVTAEPRAACAGKTEFAMYRCMQAQCRLARWQSHPQCLRLHRIDQVG